LCFCIKPRRKRSLVDVKLCFAVSAHEMTSAIARLAARAASLPAREVPAAAGARRAAVLLALYHAAGETCEDMASLRVVLTLRAAGLPTHAGQVSLPGGHIEPGESAAAAALREAAEELGAALHFTPLCRLPDAVAVTGTHVSVVLAALPLPARADLAVCRAPPAEVQSVFSLSLRALCDPAQHSWRWHAQRAGRPGLFLPVFVGGPAPVWGLTAYILHQFLADTVLPEASAGGLPADRCLLQLRAPPPHPPDKKELVRHLN